MGHAAARHRHLADPAAIATVEGWVIKEIAEFSAEQNRWYEAWKQTLTPEQHAAVQAAEIAASGSGRSLAPPHARQAPGHLAAAQLASHLRRLEPGQ